MTANHEKYLPRVINLIDILSPLGLLYQRGLYYLSVYRFFMCIIHLCNVICMNLFSVKIKFRISHNSPLGMGRTWEKFSSLSAKKTTQKFETATGKESF